MGAVKVDTNTNARRLEETYPLDKSNGVNALLSNIHHVKEMRYLQGDYDASILLIDLSNSFNQVELTDRQKQVINLVFVQDMTQQQVANMLNVTQQAISDHVNTVIQKVAILNEEKEAS